MNKIAYVEFPTYRYVEDVKELAKRAGAKIIDSRFKPEKLPDDIKEVKLKLTLKQEYKTEDTKKSENDTKEVK